jgi:uroporphyrinogen III methyltransferase/synthase
MPLKGRRVVVTRTTEQSESLLRELRVRGAEPVLLPLVAFHPPDNLSALDRAIDKARSFHWLMLTSQNALRALQERCSMRGESLEKVMQGVRIAAVGPATAESARNAGLAVTFVAEKHQGSSLVEELARELKGKKVLLPRSDRANPDLVKILSRIGAEVTEVVAYKTVRPGQNLQDCQAILDGVDAVLFFSPSAAHHLQETLGSEKFRELSRRAIFAAIGPVTGEALRKAKIGQYLLAHDSTVTAVLDALMDFFSKTAPPLSAGVQPG